LKVPLRLGRFESRPLRDLTSRDLAKVSAVFFFGRVRFAVATTRRNSAPCYEMSREHG
jgi:hypothetical protein